ncbi:hypothetical protein [Xanthomonas vasicola]|uniref:hypothetical protein n=1 Tax=Xanthomonas vasicola TaxID=56459 RepID=UPI001F224F09|nr:hypothetical protein [Xanthomonas vasicola]
MPGYPDSHGCVHLPSEFARLLFDNSNIGMVVVISQAGVVANDVVHPSRSRVGSHDLARDRSVLVEAIDGAQTVVAVGNYGALAFLAHQQQR